MAEQIPIKQTSARDLLTATEQAAIEHECTHYELRSAAAIEALKLVQTNRGWISDELLQAIAEMLHMSASELDGVATFYNHIYRHPVGHNVLHLCDSVSCWLSGYDEIRAAFEKELGIVMGQTTSDKLFTLLPNACLGACDKAPALMVNGDYVENLTVEQVAALVSKLREQTDG
ncbi:MAG: NADH-quinone oxidoreductase subunit NuoE [Aestuariibacter sp.]